MFHRTQLTERYFNEICNELKVRQSIMMQTTFWCRSETESVNITGIHFLKYSELYVLNVGGGEGSSAFFFSQFVYLSLLYKTVVSGSIYHWKRDPVGGSKSRCRAAVLTQLAKGKVMKKQCWPSSRLWRNPPKTELFTHVSMFLWVLWQLTSGVVSLPFFFVLSSSSPQLQHQTLRI